ncbi:conserved exported hypothetical protein [Thiomonas arsenitoxydans]|uniref:Secreted protein n=1 Tax=Thiomonas arsenitoxydans (strain DSM 22701 / CIP 110005 / 3As) TaxID=426114 RepID=A0ABM9T6A2_THIA3|nr:conserved exported hypothetical protein [Thiomonas arsenitoxydans]
MLGKLVGSHVLCALCFVLCALCFVLCAYRLSLIALRLCKSTKQTSIVARGYTRFSGVHLACFDAQPRAVSPHHAIRSGCYLAIGKLSDQRLAAR